MKRGSSGARRASLALFLVWGCGDASAPPPPDLERGAMVIREMLSVSKLRRAGFYEAYPDPQPSDWMAFVNSELGVILWPPREDGYFTDELALEQSRAIGETVIPAGITYQPHAPAPGASRQIVYRADDARGEIVVEAYVESSPEPVIRYRWPLPPGP